MSVAEHVWGSGFEVAGVTASPIRGPEGNVEFLMHLFRGGRDGLSLSVDALRDTVARVVAEAHSQPR